ncbi:hypothetical protein AVEN_129017-1 [Araneus ventricosus]|uniref:Uncharacterized protein n=1 Tax=Araneus ventricosus TaxID=182803 RepID=A0A4Y2JCG2_ARAVE|nr:hypothetical protein AVEN_129017-1 [Araneus ventricosus]
MDKNVSLVTGKKGSPDSEVLCARYSATMGGCRGSSSCYPDNSFNFKSTFFGNDFDASFGHNIRRCGDSRCKTCPLFDDRCISSDKSALLGCKAYNIVYFLKFGICSMG